MQNKDKHKTAEEAFMPVTKFRSGIEQDGLVVLYSKAELTEIKKSFEDPSESLITDDYVSIFPVFGRDSLCSLRLSVFKWQKELFLAGFDDENEDDFEKSWWADELSKCDRCLSIIDNLEEFYVRKTKYKLVVSFYIDLIKNHLMPKSEEEDEHIMAKFRVPKKTHSVPREKSPSYMVAPDLEEEVVNILCLGFNDRKKGAQLLKGEIDGPLSVKSAATFLQVLNTLSKKKIVTLTKSELTEFATQKLLLKTGKKISPATISNALNRLENKLSSPFGALNGLLK